MILDKNFLYTMLGVVVFIVIYLISALCFLSLKKHKREQQKILMKNQEEDYKSYKHLFEKNVSHYYMFQSLNKIENNIQIQLTAATRSSLINLYIAFILTMCAICVLGISLIYQFITPEISSLSISEFCIYYFPKVSFALFIELFALFFLKLYKSDLSKIRDYHNEIQICSYKRAALLIAIDLNVVDIIPKIIIEISKFTGNSLIPKGYTTSEIEKEKMSIKENDSIIDLLKELLKGKL